MKKTKKNRYVIATIVGIMCYFGVYIAMPIFFTTHFYIITSIFIVFCLFVLGLADKGNSNARKKRKKKKNINKKKNKNRNKKKNTGYKKKYTSIQQDINSITTYIDALSSVEKSEINENDILNIVREDNNIVLYSKYWNKIGYCNEKLSKMLTPVIDKGVKYEGIILDISGREDLQLELKIVKVNCNDTINSSDIYEESHFITTVFGVNVDERKDTVSKMKKGNEIKLIIAEDNKSDNNLIAVYNLENMKLGYLKKELSVLLVPLIGNGRSFVGEVLHITVNEDLEYDLKIKIKKTNEIQDINEIKEEIKVTELTQYNISDYFKESSNTKIAKDILYAVGRQPQTPIYDDEWINIVFMVSIMNVIKHKYNDYIEYPTGKLLNDIDDDNQKKEVIQCYELYNHILNLIYKWEYCEESSSNSWIYHPNYGLVNNEFILEEELRPVLSTSYMEFESIRKNILFKILKEENDEEYICIIESRLNNIKKIISNTKESELRNIKNQWIEELNERRKLLTEIEWNSTIKNMKSKTEVGLQWEELLDCLHDNSLYYESDYICPECSENLLYKIKVSGVDTIFNYTDRLSLLNLFTCQHCKRFYASIKTDTKISSFILRSNKYSENEYNALIDYTEKLYNDNFDSLDINKRELNINTKF